MPESTSDMWRKACRKLYEACLVETPEPKQALTAAGMIPKQTWIEIVGLIHAASEAQDKQEEGEFFPS